MTILFHLRNETPDISRERQSLQNFRLKKNAADQIKNFKNPRHSQPDPAARHPETSIKAPAKQNNLRQIINTIGLCQHTAASPHTNRGAPSGT